MKNLTEGIEVFETRSVTGACIPRPGVGMVTLHGAIHAGPWHTSAIKEPAANVAASLLDEGTKKHARDEYRYLLERDGSQVSFWSEDRYLYFSVTALREGFGRAVELCFDAIQNPALLEEEVHQVIAREAADDAQASEDTRNESGRAFTRILFSPEGAGCMVSSKDERIKTLGLSREDIVSFISKNYRGRIVLAATGDVKTEVLRRMIESATENWDQTPGESGRVAHTLSSGKEARTLFVPIPGKESVDVFAGSAIPMLPTDSAFPALRVALDLLGGGFADHLTQTIRDRDGLTYGTYARIKGARNGTGLYWGAWAMFGNALFKKGIHALQTEIAVFLSNGISSERLAEKVTEIHGRYAVKFSDMQTTVVEMLSGLLAEGNPRAADVYLSNISQLSATDVALAAERYIRIDAIAAAGAIDERGELLA